MENHANRVISQKFLGLNYATVKTSKLANLYEVGERRCSMKGYENSVAVTRKLGGHFTY
jgi:hypothetical protein